MQIIDILETLATNTRFQTNIDDAASQQLSEIIQLIKNNNSTMIKRLLNDTEISADRTTIFQI